MTSAWDDPQLALIANKGRRQTAAKDPRTCPDCGADVRHIWPGELCSIAMVIDPAPTTRTAALTAIVGGAEAVVAKTSKRDRGAGVATTWIRLTSSSMGSSWLRDLPHHIAHRCGVTNPPPPPTTAELDYPATPPF